MQLRHHRYEYRLQHSTSFFHLLYDVIMPVINMGCMPCNFSVTIVKLQYSDSCSGIGITENCQILILQCINYISYNYYIWIFFHFSSKRDVTVSVSHVLYPRLSLILKSLLAVSRSIPSYQLSRKNEDLKFKLVNVI